MKKVLWLVTVAVGAVFLAAGCGGGGKIYTDPAQAISVETHQEFVVALAANITTGYDWQESYDETMLELVVKEYKIGEAAEKAVLGAGGVDHFRFKALKSGKTEVTLVYKRPWEQGILEQKVFVVDIK